MDPQGFDKGMDGMRDSAIAESHEMGSVDEMAIANTSLDLLEQHQAKEQARLLQRFRELREWQQQQQQQLMQQQQQQLRSWQDEQTKVQSLIASQRDPQWGNGKVLKPTAGGLRSPIMTPPTKPRVPVGNMGQKEFHQVNQSHGAGISLDSGLVVSMQDTLKSQNSLPKPVMYIDPSKVVNPNDEDKYTNSELFSNPGSREEQLEILKGDEPRPAPDWMSDTSENFIHSKLPPPRPKRNGGVEDQLAGLEQLLNTAPAGLLQQVLNLLPGKPAARAPPSRSTDDVELSASPTLPGPGQAPRSKRLQFNPPPTSRMDASHQPVFPPPEVLASQYNKQQQHLLFLQQQLMQQQQQQIQQQQRGGQQQQQRPGSKSALNGLEKFGLGPPMLEPEADPHFVPRALALNDDNMSDGHRRVTVDNKEEEDDEDQWQDDDDGDDGVSDDDGSVDEGDNQNVTAKEVECASPDDRPIQGTGGQKSFEQLLEEQLREEEKIRQDKLKQEQANGARKLPFLKKGEGIARFNSAPKKPVKKRPGAKVNRKPPIAPDNSSAYDPTKSRSDYGNDATRDTEGSKKFSIGSRLKNMSKSATSSRPLPKKGGKNAPRGSQSAEDTSVGKPQAKLTLIHNAANKKMEEQRSRQKEGVTARFQRAELDHIDQFRNGNGFGGVDRSPSVDSRSKHSDDHDSTELDSLAEFELLEDAMDNMSFCSNSSLVKKLVTNNKQGHKEAMTMLKSINETKKNSGNGGDNERVSTLPKTNYSEDGEKVASVHNEVDGERRENGNGASASISNNNNINNNNINNNNIHMSKPEMDSSDVTLTDSSDEDNDDEVGHNAQQDIFKDINTASSGINSSSLPTANLAPSSSNEPLSPSRVMTRKVAPLASKFSAANDTLSMLKALSLQAGILTSNSATNSNSNVTPSFMFSGTSQSNFLSSNTAHFGATSSNGMPGFNGYSDTHTQSIASQERPVFSNTLGNSLPMTSDFHQVAPGFHSLPHDLQFNSTEMPSRSESATAFPQNNWAEPKSVISNIPPSECAPEFSNSYGFQNGNTKFDTGRNLSEEKSYNSLRYGQHLGQAEHEESNESDSDTEESDGEDRKKEESPEIVSSSRNSEEKRMPGEAEAKTGGSHSVGFDDETAWDDEEEEDDDDGQSCLKAAAVSQTSGPTETTTTTLASTPPTSKLVSKLFPKLKPKPSLEAEKANQSLHQATAQPVQAADGVPSRILREKLMELDKEIERFRSENANLEKLRREREEGLAKLKQEIQNFQREKAEELKRLEEFKAEELKKLKREKKLFDSYQKKVRSMPDKKEREEIETLKTQLQELQDELRRKESRWNASTARLKNRLAEVELENGELKEEVRILEKKRLEWMTAQSNVKNSSGLTNGKVGHADGSSGKLGNPGRQPGMSQPRSSTPTREMDGVKGQGSSGQKDKAPTATLSSTSVRSSIPTLTPATNGVVKQSNSRSNPTPAVSSHNGSSGAGMTTTSRAPSLRPPDPQPAQINLSGENLQAQNRSVPVMMENTLPNGAPSSSMPGSLASNNPCDKSAALVAMERAVVDKGDKMAFVENLHPDGKTEKTFKTGAKEICFPNGTVKEISADGQTIVCHLTNGDIRQIFPDHRVVYIFAEAQIMQTTFPDGLETFQFKNGQIERRYPDGTVEITFPSKDVKYLFPDGGQEVILTDGTVMQYNSKGERTVEYPSGDREVHTAEYQRREFPDGIIKTVYSDGRHETRFPNGRVRMRDKAGNVIMDQIVYR